MIKPHAEERVGMGLRAGCSSKLGGFLRYLPMAEASDFKFGAQLGFAKTHQKTTTRGKVGVALG